MLQIREKCGNSLPDKSKFNIGDFVTFIRNINFLLYISKILIYNMVSCRELTNYGIIFRIIVTVITFIILFSLTKGGNKFCNKYFLIILALVLVFLDCSDLSTYLYYYYYKPNSKESRCIYELSPENKKVNNVNGKKDRDQQYYNIIDKCVDTLTYIVAYFVFNLNSIFLYFLLYRIVGIILYAFTFNSRWLIVFFDFMKEYLIYFFLVKNDLSYIWIFIILKINFELYLHYY
jgi:hypothetical protein